MKKWMTVVLIALFGITASLYVFIPNTIAIQKSVFINISQRAIHRLLIENNEWDKGWPGNGDAVSVNDATRSVVVNGNTYSVADRLYSSLLLAIHRGNDTITISSLNIVENAKASVKLDWEAHILTSYNPVKRLKIYLESKEIQNDMSMLLKKMEMYLSKRENVYGIQIRQEAVTDSTLFSTYDSAKGYPKVEYIYSLITQLKNYIASRNANITGYPMLFIYTKDSLVYLTKVAIPVDRKLPPGGKMEFKWMLPGGNILVADVKGGQKAIDSAFTQMEYFVNDYGRVAPAIPFLSLVTDRMQEKDSTKWVTRIYYPVME